MSNERRSSNNGVSFLLMMALVAGAGWAAHETGYLGRAIGWARVWLFPEDLQMLTFFDDGTTYLGLAQLPLFLGEESPEIEGMAKDLEQITGVRVWLDVDTILGHDRLQVVRGRFDWNVMSESLEASGYTLTNLDYYPLAVKEDSGDVLCLVDGYLLHGTMPVVEAAIARRNEGGGLVEKSRLARNLELLGWRHGAVFSIMLDESGADVGEILSGKAEVRAVGMAVDADNKGYPFVAHVDLGSAGQAEIWRQRILDGRQTMADFLEKKNKGGDVKPLVEAIRATEVEIVESGDLMVRTLLPKSIVRWAADQQKSSLERENRFQLNKLIRQLESVTP